MSGCRIVTTHLLFVGFGMVRYWCLLVVRAENAAGELDDGVFSSQKVFMGDVHAIIGIDAKLRTLFVHVVHRAG